MKLLILFTGKTQGNVYPSLINEYVHRLSHYIPIQIEEIPDLKNTKSLSEEQQKEKEADMVFDRMQGGDVLVLLDERGKEMTSREFSQWMEQKMQTVLIKLFLNSYLLLHIINGHG